MACAFLRPYPTQLHLALSPSPSQPHHPALRPRLRHRGSALPWVEGQLPDLRLVPVADGMPEGTVASEREMIRMFLVAMPGSLLAELDAAVSDAFLWMAGEVAEAAGVPWVPLYTDGPVSLAAHFHAELLRDVLELKAMTTRAAQPGGKLVGQL